MSTNSTFTTRTSTIAMEEMATAYIGGLNDKIESAMTDVTYTFDRDEGNDWNPRASSLRIGIGGTCREDSFLKVEFNTRSFDGHPSGASYQLILPLRGSKVRKEGTLYDFGMRYEAKEAIVDYFTGLANVLTFNSDGNTISDAFAKTIGEIAGRKATIGHISVLKKLYGQDRLIPRRRGLDDDEYLFIVDRLCQSTHLFGINRIKLSAEKQNAIKEAVESFSKLFVDEDILFIGVRLIE